MVNIDPENEEHMTVMSRVFGLPRATLRMHMKTVRGILAAWDEVQEKAKKE